MNKTVESLLNYGKRIDNYEGLKIDVTLLTYAYVKNDFFEMINEGDLSKLAKECLSQLFHLTDAELSDLKDSYLLGVFVYLYDEILTEKGIIHRLESSFLKSKVDTKMIAAGQSKLDPYSYKHTLMSLAGGRILDMKEISLLPYGEILDIQVIKKIEGEIQQNYADILRSST